MGSTLGVLYPFSDFWGVFFAKKCVFGRFSSLAQKIYFIHFFRSDKNIGHVFFRLVKLCTRALTQDVS